MSSHQIGGGGGGGGFPFTGDASIIAGDLVLDATQKLYLDGVAGVAGSTYIYEASDGRIEHVINGTPRFVVRSVIEAGTNLQPTASDSYDLGSGSRYWRNIFCAGYTEWAEETVAPLGATDVARVYAENNGGKTRLMVMFQTGAAVQIATEA